MGLTSGKVLIVDDVHSILPDGLSEMGLMVDYKPAIKRDEILSAIEEYEGLVVRSKTPIDHEMLAGAKKLKWIARAGSGLENIDSVIAGSNGIEVFSAAEGNEDAVGEMAVGLILALLRNIPKANDEVGRMVWNREGNRGIELNNCTVGIWGYGHTGSALGRKLSGFGCRILAYDKYKTGFGNESVEEVKALDIMENADIVSFHIPLTDETYGLISAGFLSKFQKPVYLLNLSRGQIARTDDILKALYAGKIQGCALDVLEHENFGSLKNDFRSTYQNLMKRSNVILTPHIAGWTVQSYRKISSVLLSKIKGFYENPK